MKIHRLVQMLGLINESGRLASDMYDLNNKEYYSKSEGKYIPISHMDFQHLVRAFVKQNDEDIRNDTQEGKIAYLKEDIKQNYVRKDVYEMLFDKCERLESMLSDLKEKLYGIDKSPHPRYVFSEIPRNMYGDAFVDALKKYLNKKRYSLKVRGQHVKDEYKGTGVTDYGQNIEQSTHLRVYIEEK